MKYIKLKAFSDGSVKVLRNDLQFYIDNDGAELWVDFSSADVSGLRKWVDFVMADGSETSRPILAEFTTADTLTISLGNTITKTGPLKLQPYANDPISGQRINFETIKIIVGPSLNVLSDSSFEDQTAIAEAFENYYAEDEVDALIEHTSVPRWTDLTFPFTQTRVGANLKPDFDFTNIGLLFPQNDTSEIVYITVQMPHGYKEGTPINPHIHAIQKANQAVRFDMDYKWYNVGDTEPVSWTKHIINQYEIPYTSGNLSQIIEGASMIDGTGKKISSILKIKLFRNDNTYTGDFFADQFDIHYQVDAYGSEDEYVK